MYKTNIDRNLNLSQTYV